MFHFQFFFIVIIIFCLTSCGLVKKDKKIAGLNYFGQSNSFFTTEEKAFNNMAAVENSLILFEGKIISFFDPAANSTMYRASLGEDGRGFSDLKMVMPGDARFSYVMNYNGGLLNFVTIGGAIYRLESTDGGESWINKQLVLSPDTDPASLYYQIWNVGVDIDEDGTWHMLLESSDSTLNQEKVGLTYATSLDGLTWTKHPGFVVPRGGNPYVKAIPGKGILVIHGQVYDPYSEFGIEWYVTASTFNGEKWVTHKNKFLIGKKGIHVCDPHMIETSNGILLTVSYNQNAIYKAESKDASLESLYDRLVE